MNNLNGTNDVQLQKIKNNIIETTLNSLNIALNNIIESCNSELYDFFVAEKNENNSINNNIFRISQFESIIKSCDNNPTFCTLLTKCNICLDILLITFTYLNNNNYYMEYFNEIQNYILAIKNSLSL